jgi:hypothetical protein
MCVFVAVPRISVTASEPALGMENSLDTSDNDDNDNNNNNDDDDDDDMNMPTLDLTAVTLLFINVSFFVAAFFRCPIVSHIPNLTTISCRYVVLCLEQSISTK